MSETQALAEFGKKFCDVPGYADCFCSFRTNGYPRKLRREWDAAADADQVWAIVARYISAWNLHDLNGQAIELPAPDSRPTSIVDNVEDAVVSWLIRAFTTFWLVELPSPRPNS